jgi:hypothetical protein
MYVVHYLSLSLVVIRRIGKIAKNVCPIVRPFAEDKSVATGQISIKFDIYRKGVGKIRVSLTL